VDFHKFGFVSDFGFRISDFRLLRFALIASLRLNWFLRLLPLLVLPFQAHAQLTTILTNGPVSNRFNIVFLSEGYTSSQLAKFRTDAANAMSNLLTSLTYQPYGEYSNYFNAFAISVASTNSGSNHPLYGPTNLNTYFNSSYDDYVNYLITIPPDAFDTNYSHGQGKVDALIQTNAPWCNLPVLLVNDSVQGGSDGFDKTAITATAGDVGSMTDVLCHETGHVIADLGDEYSDNPYNAATHVEEANTTQQTNRASIKWNAWIDPTTPVPTPASDADYFSSVGLFEGANYSPTNWYRPEVNCMMNTVGVPFCEVCSEAMILGFYQKVRPIDSFLPANTNLTLTNKAPMTFSVTLLQPTTHSLSVQWYTNGAAVSGATNTSLVLLPQGLASGTNFVSAVVVDPTPLVRNDPTNLLHQTNTWALNVPSLALDSPQWLAGGKFAFHVTGNAPQGFAILGSTNLSTWVALSTNSLVAGQFTYTNSSGTNLPLRFYRAKTPP
jgi:hypothetical protein